MNLLSTCLLALSLSADAFAVAAAKGSALRAPRPVEALRTGATFGAIEGSMPIIGWLLGSAASSFVTSVDHWIAFAILAALGGKMIWESLTCCCEIAPEEKPTRHGWRALLIAGVGSSIDSLGVGVTLAFVDANIWLTAAIIALTTCTMATLGTLAGHALGCRIGKGAEIVGGIVLIGIGVAIVAEHLGLV